MLPENPLSFIIHRELLSFTIEYRNLGEICQGGPEVGEMYINNTKVEGYSFGGPFIIHEHYIILPTYIRCRFVANKFKLALIDAITLEVTLLSQFYDIIFPFKIQNLIVYCYTDLNGNTSAMISIKDTYLKLNR